MFPCTILEKLFDEYNPDAPEAFSPEVLLNAAKLAEEWLMGFADETDPGNRALACLVSHGDIENDTRLNFAFSLALCTPSESTGRLFHAFIHHFSIHARIIGACVADLTKNLAPHVQIDAFRAFDALPEKRLYKLARAAYQVSEEDVRLAALASDNLKVFINTLEEGSPGQREVSIKALARFAINEESHIYRALIQSAQDEYDLVFCRLLKLRDQLGDEYTNGIELSNHSGLAPVLIPKKGLQLVRPSLNQYPPVNRTKEFTKALESNPIPLVAMFYKSRADIVLIKSENLRYVDELTRAFLDAGVRAELIVHQGLIWEGGSAAQLMRALDNLGKLSPLKQRYYQVAYKAYFAQFTTEQIINACADNKAMLAAYNITGDKAFLQAGSDLMRASAMASDLGL